MSNWIDTSIDNVSVAWDEDTKTAKISHRYEVDSAGEPVESVDHDAILRAAETALDTIDVHVLLGSTANADAGEAAPDGWAEAVMYPKVDGSWVPTHRITFTPQGGEPEITFVMLTDGAAYDRDEWRAEVGAAWGVGFIEDGGPNGSEWRCEGQVTPGGQNGEVEIETLDEDEEAVPFETDCPCDVCAKNTLGFDPSTGDAEGLFAEPEAYALACAEKEIESHDNSDAREEWGREIGWEEEAAEWTQIDPKGLESLRAWHALLPDGVFEDFLDQARAKFKTRFCSIMAKHYAWVLS